MLGRRARQLAIWHRGPESGASDKGWAARFRACPESETNGNSFNTRARTTPNWSPSSRTSFIVTTFGRSSSRAWNGSRLVFRYLQMSRSLRTRFSAQPWPSRPALMRNLYCRDSARSATSMFLLSPRDGTLLYVTIYTDGRIRGCMGSVVSDLRRNIRELVDAALEDPRFANERQPHSRLAVMTSWLYRPLTLGVMSDEDVVGRHRFGEQALMAFDGENCGFILPWFAARNDWTETEYIEQVRSKAGIAEQTCGWRRFDVRTWCADSDGAFPVRGAFKDTPSKETTPALVRRLTTLTLSYLVRNQRRDGGFFFRYRPAENILSGDSDLPRMAHGRGCWLERHA